MSPSKLLLVLSQTPTLPILYVFLTVICLLVCLKGSDKILKKREIKLERKGSTKKSANEDVVNSVSSQDQEEATTETTAMIVASSKEADRYNLNTGG